MLKFTLPTHKILSSVEAFFVVYCGCCLFLLETAPVLAQWSPNSPRAERAYDAHLQGYNALFPAEHGAYYMLPMGIASGGMSDAFGSNPAYFFSGLPRQWFLQSTMIHYDRVIIETFQTSGILRLDSADTEIATFGNTLGFGYIVFDTTLSQTTKLNLFPFLSTGVLTSRFFQPRITFSASLSALYTIDISQRTAMRRNVGFAVPIRIDIGYTRHYTAVQSGLEDIGDGGGVFLRVSVGIGPHYSAVVAGTYDTVVQE